MFITIFLLLLAGLTIVTRGKKSIWVPSPSCWLKAIGLAIPTWIGCTAIFSLEVWHGVFLIILAAFKSAPLSAIRFFSLFAIGFLFISLVWYLLIVILYSLALRLLWKELPQFLHWLKPPKKKRDILFGWAASNLAVLVGATPFLLITFYSRRLIVESLNLRGLTDDVIVGKMFSGWYVAAVYLYYLRSYINFRHKNRQARSQVT